MRTNAKVKIPPVYTHEGGHAARITAEQQLRRSVMACMLWESEFYEDGAAIADRLRESAKEVKPPVLAALAIEARTVGNLRHVPLYLTALLAQNAAGSSIVSETIRDVIQRADELTEFLAIYAKVNGVTTDKLKPKLSNQVRKGLAMAFGKFGPYALAKYNRDHAIKLRDVLFMCHAKPVTDEQKEAWSKLIDGTLAAPDTWEVALSGGADKRETFTRLIEEGNLGYMALLRNLRNMEQAGVDVSLVRDAIVARKGAQRVLPFRYVAAARAAPSFEPALDKALLMAINELPMLRGCTRVLMDVSDSMNQKLSAKSDMTRMDAGATLAAMINAESLRMFSFSQGTVEVPPRRGMAGVDAIRNSQPHRGTYLVDAVEKMNRTPHDRLIIITDEQMSEGRLPDPVCKHAYVINVASARNGVGYGKWNHIDGFSEQVLRWIIAHESMADQDRAAA